MTRKQDAVGRWLRILCRKRGACIPLFLYPSLFFLSPSIFNIYTLRTQFNEEGVMDLMAVTHTLWELVFICLSFLASALSLSSLLSFPFLFMHGKFSFSFFNYLFLYCYDWEIFGGSVLAEEKGCGFKNLFWNDN